MDRQVDPAAIPIQILPYSRVVGQERLKLALELAYIAPRLSGVLIAGQRGTAKSTAVRAFARMVYGDLPVTLPINASEDRVIGGWDVESLMRGKPTPQAGLLEEANGGLLYVDEVNLLDDHIVNLILDVTSTGVLSSQREGLDSEQQLAFTLVGTMNPEEGSLRPQLLDRFALLVAVSSETDQARRSEILLTVMEFDSAVAQARRGVMSQFMLDGEASDCERREQLITARENFASVEVSREIAKMCVALATEFDVEGHRADYVLATAARALAALKGNERVEREHVREVAPLALNHRRREFLQSSQWFWSDKEEARLDRHLPR